MVTDVKSLVDADSGLINRRIFSDPDIYQQVFERTVRVGLSSKMTWITGSGAPIRPAGWLLGGTPKI